MPPTPRELKPSSSARALFGAEQRRLRVAAGMSLDRMAEIVNYSKSHLHGVEVAERLPLPPLPEKLDMAFGTGELFAGLWEVIKRERTPKRFDHCLELEAKAVRIQAYGASLVPGLLQTDAYMRTLIRWADPGISSKKLDGLVAERLSRQEVLRKDNSPDFWAVVDEAVLRRAVGGHALMVEQLAALLPYVDTGRTTIQVVPFARCEGPLMRGTLTFLTLPDNSMGLYEEGDEIWDVFEDRQTVTRRLWQYDRMKACALSPSASASFIEAAIEDHRHASDPWPYPHPVA
ncbi:helix-turn-helix domain-containing protein [Actinacidiphila acididurans]|uniref:Helix-turn-helix domain-containing protein n=1 Tax=Actinacidiphila acididurans TaxID=2784346 RepID=A0ABS2TZS2_9ACTN|nr:helix-turn-helix transcriptional regulator [Actinacidiphila acididurans]MBM9508845.1 helix-turn-helix domain-containing protein [Actinacidiphila acididurans]